MSTQQALLDRSDRQRRADLAALEEALIPAEWRRPPAPAPLRRIEFAAEAHRRRPRPATSARQRAALAAVTLLAVGAAAVAGLALLVNRPPAQSPLRTELNARVDGLRAQIDREMATLQARVVLLHGQLVRIHAEIRGVRASIPQREVDILGNQLRGVAACLPELQQELGGLTFTTRPDRKTGDLAAAELRDTGAVSGNCETLLGPSLPGSAVTR